MFRVTVTTAKSPPQVLRCVNRRCEIGRGSENPIVLQGWNIAKTHASLQHSDKGIFIAHENGRAPVLVNGEKIADPYGPLSTEDTIQIGAYSLTVNVEAPDDAPATAAHAIVGAEVALIETGDAAPSEKAPPVDEEFIAWRRRVHEDLVREMDLRRTDVRAMSEERLRRATAGLIQDILKRIEPELPQHIDRRRLAKQVLDEAIGLGPLEDLIADESVTEIMVNCFNQIYVERAGRLEQTEVSFTGDKAVASAIERIVAPLGRRIDESSPMVDARLPDGSRVNAVIPPVALRGPSITIRKFSKRRLEPGDLLRFGAVSDVMIEFLRIAVEQRCSILVSGGTGTGKTTLLNILSSFIPASERIVTIEDAAELRLHQPNLVSLEARPANLEGKGEIAIRDLVRNALRMRPDRIVVGECRGGEAVDMLQAMNTGHDGSLTTIHANTPRDMLSRLEVMTLMSNMDLPVSAIREQVTAAVDIIIQQRRFACGSRKVTQICEVTGIESGTIQLQDLFVFRQTDFGGRDGKVRGRFLATGAIPEFYEALAESGYPVDLGLFAAGRELA
jgi:pilus assembly protein CpaF